MSDESRNDPQPQHGPERHGDTPQARGSSISRWPWRGIGGALLAGITLVGASVWWNRPTAEKERGNTAQQGELAAVALPDLPESPFLNTRDAVYTGNEACIGCHVEEFESLRSTGMGRSLARTDPADVPQDAIVDHPASQRRYKIYRAEGKLRHREILLNSGSSEEVVLADHVVPWVIGSGRHSRSYLAEIDGFLTESPVTWYARRSAWEMSPGYDHPRQGGFQRAVDESCLGCHAGQVATVDGTLHRMQITEPWISCERCHGPGSAHVARWTTGAQQEAQLGQQTERAVDYSIVNQAHLNRDLSDAVCAQCHLRSSAAAQVRGRKLNDFRPGLPLMVCRADYRLEGGDEKAMTVVGHVEQLGLSRCYNNSQLSCITCHNPHAFPPVEQRVAWYRSKCLECHTMESCRVSPAVLERQSPDNDCVHCHMPATDTDIPHFAFTHHRIGIHTPAETTGAVVEAVAPAQPGTLRSLTDLSSYSEADRTRMLGLAYMELAQSGAGQRYRADYERQAADLLKRAWQAGLRDAEVAGNLATLAARAQSPEMLVFATAVLEDSDSSPSMRLNALLARASWHQQKGSQRVALDALREVVRMRRHSGDWQILGELEQQVGRPADGIGAFEKALEIDPMDRQLRGWLIDYYQRNGPPDRVRWHQLRMPR